MGDRWGDEGPPPEAYSRVTRDLREVTADFAAYLTKLPVVLVDSYECVTRELTTDELQRLRGASSGHFDEAYAVQPADPSATTLLIGRERFQEGASVTLGLGIATNPGIPSCFCDACDEDRQLPVRSRRRRRNSSIGITRYPDQQDSLAKGQV